MRTVLLLAAVAFLCIAGDDVKCHVGYEKPGERVSKVVQCKEQKTCFHYYEATEVEWPFGFVITKKSNVTKKFGCGDDVPEAAIVSCKDPVNVAGTAEREDKKLIVKMACCDYDKCNSSPVASPLFAIAAFVALASMDSLWIQLR
uniref:Activin_recp domain-containing protein n=1 Tax=Steinernema glaseri TaxID=37863 RepID=A0A1I7Y769_9BILA